MRECDVPQSRNLLRSCESLPMHLHARYPHCPCPHTNHIRLRWRVLRASLPRRFHGKELPRETGLLPEDRLQERRHLQGRHLSLSRRLHRQLLRLDRRRLFGAQLPSRTDLCPGSQLLSHAAPVPVLRSRQVVFMNRVRLFTYCFRMECRPRRCVPAPSVTRARTARGRSTSALCTLVNMEELVKTSLGTSCATVPVDTREGTAR